MHGEILAVKVLTPIKAIRAKCLDCAGGQYKEVRLCTVKTCPTWPYRMGKRPVTKQGTSVDTRKEAAETAA